jgi:hypothetical protein
MRVNEFLIEAADPAIIQLLKSFGYNNLKVIGNRIAVLIPTTKTGKTALRTNVLQQILVQLKQKAPKMQPEFSRALPTFSSIGHIQFAANPTVIAVKDENKQGDKSAGVGNEIEVANMIQEVIKNHGTANVTFYDSRGKELIIEGVTNVEISGRSPGTRKGGGQVKKADVVLVSPKRRLPVSVKELSAESWESGDSAFGARAREILDKLVKQKLIKIMKDPEVPGNFIMNKEVVVEPTPEEALRAVFGADINPDGGIVIQTFKKEHFEQDGINVRVHCHAVIQNKEDIPESHLMVWHLRNNRGRLSKSLGIRGIRPVASVLKRAWKPGKDVVVVDVNGNVVQDPIRSPV